MASEMDCAALPSMDRLKDHYKHCIRLSASNKINPKNAFDLQLIDYMQDLVSTADDEQMNFKIASSALDVGAKIYSSRVDCIQSEAQKVASSIMMALDGKQQADDLNETHNDPNSSTADDRINDSSEAEEQAKEKKRKRHVRNKNVKTVLEDTALLDAKLEKMVLGDAFLDGLSQDYDMSCPAALICYNALTQPNCVLTIESNNLRKDYREPPGLAVPDVSVKQSNTPLPVIPEEEEEQETDDPDKTQIQDESETDKTAECKTDSQTFKIDQDGDAVMREEADQTAQTKSSNQDATKNSTTQGFMSNASSEQCAWVSLITKHNNCAKVIRDNVNNSICPRLDKFLFNDRSTTIMGLNSNDESIMIAQLDVPQHQTNTKPTGGEHQFDPGMYENNAGDDYDDHFNDAESVCPNGKEENDLIPNLDHIAASKPTDYVYSKENHRLLNTWAGPHAWKAVKVPPSTKKEMPPKSARKRLKLELKPIEFEEQYSEVLEKPADKEIRHSADVIRRWKKPLLPQDHNLTEETVRSTLIHTFLRPEDTYHCMLTPADAAKVVDKDHDYSKNDDFYDAPASPMGGFDEVHDEDSDDEFRADPIVGNEIAIYGGTLNTSFNHNDLEFAGEHLIEQPYTVAQVNIPFAKIAKKMDVRKLKRVMWDLLLPPEKRLELTMLEHNNNDGCQINGTINQAADDNEEMEVETTNDGDETVIEAGSEGALTKSTKKTPSPTPSESAVHLEFSSLYGELPPRVSDKMASDLSIPIAFVTLLHLTNEKNLKLIPKQDLKDFLIEQDDSS